MTLTARRLYRHLVFVFTLYFLLVAIGSGGYILIEGWPWTDSVYMTVITISTVGFGEIRPLSPIGRVFTGGLIVLGVSTTAYAISTLADVIVAGEFRSLIWRKRMQNRIDKMNGHFIVCGYGRVGEQVVHELLGNRVSLVVIEILSTLGPDLENLGVIPVEGNATDDAALLRAGIERASGICCCLPNDSDNVYVALTARALNRDLTIISRANSHESERKLLIAGVNHVINPYVTSGRRMARQLIHPNILEFMDVVMHRGEVDILIEDIGISERSTLRDQTIADTEVRRRLGANILAVRRPDGETFVNPGVEFALRAGDTIIALGTPDQLDRLATEAEDRKNGT
ncbi:MAG: potassium channel protein [Caldilineaceae bacterium]|nr:potassium channel protein [Caldilineaceae bacterium]